jgi:hypothetical protein
MSVLKTIEKMICNYNINHCRMRHLYIAYLELHTQNPGLHPDNAMYNGSGYTGWQAVLVNAVLSSDNNMPDTFRYPYSFIKLDRTLEELLSFHMDLVVDAGNDSVKKDIALEYVEDINSILMWFEDTKPSELDGIVTSLQKLYLYHASENNSAEEEAEKPAGILKDCADVLLWVQTQL